MRDAREGGVNGIPVNRKKIRVFLENRLRRDGSGPTPPMWCGGGWVAGGGGWLVAGGGGLAGWMAGWSHHRSPFSPPLPHNPFQEAQSDRYLQQIGYPGLF